MNSFEYYLKKGVVRKISIDNSRAESLINESKIDYKVLKDWFNKISDKSPGMVIKNSYDVIMGLIRARMFKDGYKSYGVGAHEAEVSYLTVLGFSERDIKFMDKLRFFRNKILYEGKSLDEEYANKVIRFLDKVVKELV